MPSLIYFTSSFCEEARDSFQQQWTAMTITREQEQPIFMSQQWQTSQHGEVPRVST